MRQSTSRAPSHGAATDSEGTVLKTDREPLARRLLALLPLAAVTTVALTAVVVKLQRGLNVGWDTYAFLCNAAHMAGQSVGYLEPTRPPFMSFLTSLLMRLGVGGETSILLVDVGMSAVGVVALYYLLARRFPKWMAAAGSLLLIGVPPFWAIVGTGMTDFVSLVPSLLAVLAVIKATEEDPRWYWVAFPLVVVSFLTRYGALLMIVPIALWLILRARPFRDAKHITWGLLAAVLTYIPAGLWYMATQGDFLFPAQVAGQVSEGDFAVGGQLAQGASTVMNAAKIPGQYYFENLRFLILPESMGIIGTLVLLVTGAGLLTAAFIALSPKRSGWRWLAPLAVAAVAVVAQAAGGTMLRMLTIVAFGLATAWTVRPRTEAGARTVGGDDAWALDAVVMTWGLVFLDAHGHMAITIDRYFLTMVPAVIYFMLVAWRTLGTQIVRSVTVDPRRQQARDARTGVVGGDVAAFVVVGLIAATAAFASFTSPAVAFSDVNTGSAKLIAGLTEAARWMRSNDPAIRDKTVLSTAWPHMSWALGQYVAPMPPLRDRTAVAWELQKRRADYFVELGAVPYPGYRMAFTGSGRVTVLQRTEPFDEDAPRILYLGRGWDTYLERVADYDFELLYGRRRGTAADEWRLDRPTVEEMERYDAVAIYGVDWDDRAKGERNLQRYVERGGVVVIDASRNMAGLRANLVDTALFGMLIRRVRVAPDARLTLESGLTRASGSTETVDTAAFVDETGGPWFGAEYTPLDPDARPEVLARLDGRPVVLRETIGLGSVYWIGSNLVWHAFLNEDDPKSGVRRPGSPESDFVRGVIRSALGLPSQAAASGPGAQ